jgi:hypothetical protein
VDPRGELRRTLDFIGLDDVEPSPALLEYGARAPGGPRYEPGANVREAFIATLAEDLTRLVAEFPRDRPHAVALLPRLDLEPGFRERGFSDQRSSRL